MHTQQLKLEIRRKRFSNINFYVQPNTYRGLLLSTLLQVILSTSHHLLNVLLQLANKLGLKKKN
jgi:hypothetical protein